MKRKNYYNLFSLCILLLTLDTNIAMAQMNQAVTVSVLQNESIGVLWVSQEILSPQGVNIYRSENGGAYTKITSAPITIGQFPIDETKYQSNKTIQKVFLNKERLKTAQLGNAMGFEILLEALKYPEFAEYLGIEYQDKEFIKGSKYKYKVMQILNGSEQIIGESAEIIASVYKGADPPKNIKFKVKRSRSIGFTWEPETDRYIGFNIYCSSTGNANDEKKINAQPMIVNKIINEQNEEVWPEYFYSCDTLKKGRNYNFRFAVIDFFGSEGEKSQTFTSKAPDLDPPLPVEDLHITEEGTKIAIQWKLPKASDDMAGFNVYRSYPKDDNFIKVNANSIDKAALTFSDKVDKPGFYYYLVATVDASGNDSKSGHMVIEATDRMPPAIPKNLKIKAEPGKITVSWDKNEEPDFAGYLIYRSNSAVEGKSNDPHYGLINIKPSKETSYIETKAEFVKNDFYYEIMAVDTNYNKSELSPPVKIHLPDVTPPHKPFIKEDEVLDDGSVKITWLPNLEEDLAGYNVFRSQKGDSANFKLMNTKPFSNSTTSFTDKEIKPDVDYYYYIIAFDSIGNKSKPSHVEHVDFPQLSDKLAPLTDLKAAYNKEKKGVLLSWSAKKNDAIIGYTVFRKVEDETKAIPLSGMISEANYVDDKLDPKYAQFEYEVHEFSKHGTVVVSNKVIYLVNTKK